MRMRIHVRQAFRADGQAANTTCQCQAQKGGKERPINKFAKGAKYVKKNVCLCAQN